MQNYGVLAARIIIIREADTTILHFAFPRHWGRYKKYPPPEQSGVGYKSIPRFHPGYGDYAVTH